ncbi:MAG TPA: DUF948 domain-containing protein [Desulfuromonadales bacterium]|nr:DUF948 domain-containing protein [Desulfuromonadales bacterium]
MSLTGIALIIIAVAFCILVLTLVPAILAFKRTTESVTSLSEMIKTELKPTLQELTEVLSELKTVGGGIAEHTDDVLHFMSALGETGTNLQTINQSVGVVTNILNTTSVWATGAKVAGKYMLDHYLKKRGGK